jgi:FkbM family methyltransferase
MLARGMNKPLIRRSWDAITRLPLVGNLLHRIARGFLPAQERVWVRMSYQEFPGHLFWLKVDPRYEYGQYQGTHDAAVQKFLVSLLKPGDCFYDVGAHTGFFSILAAFLVGMKGNIVAVEPYLQNIAVLREAIARNSLGSTIDIVEHAVWSRPGNVKLLGFQSGPHSNPGMSKIVPWNTPGSYEVACTTLDALSEAHPPPTLIKIDVEGAESKVLEGAARLFIHSRPQLICEVHDPENSSFVETWLEARGYVIRWLETSDELAPQLVAWPK